jgi:hypothetical protein
MTTIAILVRSVWRALQWRLLILTPVVMLAASAASLVWLWQFFGAQLDHSPRWQSLTTLDSSGFAALAKALTAPGAGTGLVSSLITSVVLGLVLSPFVAGAALVVATEDDRPRLADLLAGAARYYPRLFRMQIAAIVPLAIAAVAAAGVHAWASHVADHATEDAATHTSSRIAWAVTLVAVFVAQLVIDAGRARLAVEPARRSAVVALGAGIKLLVRAPVSALVIGLVASAASLASAAALLVLRQRIEQTSPAAVVGAFALGQFAVAAIGWGHAVRLCGLVELVREERGDNVR